MSTARRIVLVLVAGAGLLTAGVAAGQDPPTLLWEEFPLVPTETIPGLEEEPPPPTDGGVAGVQAGGPRPGAPAGDSLAPIGPDEPLGAFPLTAP